MATKKPVYVDALYGTIAPTEENDEKKWYVVRTKPQREKKIAQWAKDREIEYYLPQFTSLKIYKYRKIEFTKPMFPGYIFVKMTKSEQLVMLRPGHIVTFVRVPNEQELVAELQQIYVINKFGLNVHPIEDYTDFESGTRVRVKDGSLKGLMGSVINIEDTDKILVSVNIIHQAVEVTLDKMNLEIIEVD